MLLTAKMEDIMAKEINKVLVVGAGTMGSGIAQVFAGSGFKTTMADLKLSHTAVSPA